MKLKKENLIFRFATEEDAEKILKIYEQLHLSMKYLQSRNLKEE